jgi:hypothetical protein
MSDTIPELIALPNIITTAHAAGAGNVGLGYTNRISAQTVIDILHGRAPQPQCVFVEGDPVVGADAGALAGRAA